jgi:hypothetical protein
MRYGRVDAYRALVALGSGSTGGGGTGSAPANSGLPALAGTAQVGQTLSGSAGTWTGSAPVNYEYQWERCDSSGGGSYTFRVTGSGKGSSSFTLTINYPPA